MSKGNTYENDILAAVFHGTAFSWTANSYFYVALHSADPGEGGDQTTNEISYTGYARVQMIRTSAGWTISGNTVSNTVIVQFGACTAGSATATYASVGTASSGAGQILYSGALTAGLAISAPIAPNFPVGTLVMTED